MIEKIISGSQTGSDRAGLDFGILHGIVHGGECPLGRRSENGRIPDKYNLIESHSANYLPRTLANVQNSDAILICTLGSILTGGSWKTQQFCVSNKKPYLHLHPKLDNLPTVLVDFIKYHDVQKTKCCRIS